MHRLLARLGPFAKGFAGAIAGMLLVLLLVHAWFDHIALHDLVNMVNAAKAQPAQAPQPAPSAAPPKP